MTIEQKGESETYANYSAPDDNPVGSGEASIIHDYGTSKVVKFIPLQVGMVKLEIVALFADGGVATQEYSVNVAPNSEGIQGFNLHADFLTLPIVLDSGNPDPHAKLSPTVRYDGLRNPIYLDCNGVQLRVEQSEGDPVIRLDHDGVVHALRPGNATIIGDFDGISAQISVHVYDEKHAFIGHYNPYIHQIP